MEKIKYSMILAGVEDCLRSDYPDLDEETLVHIIEKAQTTCLSLAFKGCLPYGKEYREFSWSKIPAELEGQMEGTLMEKPMLLDFEGAKWLVFDLELHLLRVYPQKGAPFGPLAREMVLLSLVRADQIDFDG